MITSIRKKQRWIKKGLIFGPPADLNWMVSHAMTPFVERIGEDLYKVYFSGRDTRGRSQIGFFIININEPRKIIGVSEKPVLSFGPLGAFDDSGVTSPWIVEHLGVKYLFYAGWSLGKTVPFYFYAGLAVSHDKGYSFRRIYSSPILNRDPVDPYLTGSPCVLIENNTWRMWYVSGVKWVIENNQPKHFYHIKYAESLNGINWERKGIVCIDFNSDAEHALARPFVLKEDGIYKMWYSYRGSSYRIGYAESNDGINWDRLDADIDLDVSESGWDSEMIEYACIFDHYDDRYMLYNGNSYGRTGIGLAILDKE